ncbi:GNAT family N-acetyltransferase [Erythrobacter mangrovi]|uniref:GNAT family N-acetyltransferase n=1 Tax=Erythrobacter mangrovi TaxID=2739433 RepID=A0A7D4B6X8_9SPHN|nr:GNAT family N-acetyltransferase [Erythrobacter mangrovi]QKG70703.1 GNAT family N-acetyltransferase [Erythrobacter mangrovi]
MDQGLTARWATEDDIPALRNIMDLAIEQLQRGFLSPEQIAASRAVMGLDTQLIADRTYCVIEDEATPVGCGGWSNRNTLYGGDHSTDLRNASLLDPMSDPARIRAMYTHPEHARRGIGKMILDFCEGAARDHGFTSVELMATMSGVPLYKAAGYVEIEPRIDVVDGIEVPLVRMRKGL